MRYAGHFLRKAAITALTGNIDIGDGAIPVYGQVPRSNSDSQYIIVQTTGGNESDFNKDVFNQVQVLTIEAVDRSKSSQKGFLDSEKIISLVTDVIRTRQSNFLDLSSDDFSIYKMSNGGFQNLKEPYSDNTYFRTIATFEFSITDELS